MNVRCPSCNTVYRIDPAKVSGAGVRARCTVCSHVIPVTRDEEAAAPAPTTVAAGTQHVPEPREPSSSQEEIAATLGEAFIAAPEEPGGGDSETPVTEAAPAPPPVPVAPSTEPAFLAPEEVPGVAEVTPQPPVSEPKPGAPVVETAPSTDESPSPPPPPSLAPEPSGPELVRPLAMPPVAEVGVEAVGTGPTAVPPEPPPTPVPEAPSPVGRGGGRLRVTRPFSHPGPGPIPSPSQQGQGPQRPTAPVFRPTPGRPLQPASAPPAEPMATATAPTVVEPAMPVEPAAPPAVTEAAGPVGTPTPMVAQPAPQDQTAEAAVPAPAAPAAPSGPAVNPFMSRDPKLKARRLARALISDMIVYQPEKRQQALDSGNLKEVFEGEIKKSWEEYVVQVGEEIANSTPYFTEALNEILAGGQPVF